MLEGFPDSQSEARWVVATIQALLANQTAEEQAALSTADIGIVARTHAQLSDFEQALNSAGLPLLKLSRSQADDRSRAGIRLATMHRIKGLEFRYVFIVGVNDGVVPLHNAIAHTEDETERRASELNERALLHVAATRAIRGLWVTWNGRGSPFLE